MNNKYQIFGSKSSVDYDMMIFVNTLGTTQESHDLCLEYDKILGKIFTDKPVNSNLAILENGIIIKVFKGSFDEVNNALFLTYDNHDQPYHLMVSGLIDRDIHLKMLRTARVLLSFLSRTEHRKEVKFALRSDFKVKLETLLKLNLSKINNLGSRNVIWEDYLKIMSFQLGQTLSLMNGKELYTKEIISENFPKLESMLNRNGENLNILEEYKNIFVNSSYLILPDMKRLIE